ncbi:hypothetical protein EDD16DRAFT_404001 [Pisolithus croceorrhizus]|nr:hypothetical protein EDD16DRAFT_404001 [Pisolithus croceorrhizus]KAI6161876.1 hypothetical protein EDD17DRAFT_1583411 [Pisolithus thermaeus]
MPNFFFLLSYLRTRHQRLRKLTQRNARRVPPFKRATSGGNGCIVFHRERFKSLGPPSGENGGRGSEVYILPIPAPTTLSSVL